MSATRPTKKQRELLSYITNFIASHGYGPSYREIMRALDYKSVSTVAIHVDNLIARGHLRKRENSARSLELTNDSEPVVVLTKQKAEPSQEKWLVDLIAAKFDEVEQKPPQSGEIDQLYVLVGALHILGLQEAAQAYKSRLSALQAK